MVVAYKLQPDKFSIPPTALIAAETNRQKALRREIEESLVTSWQVWIPVTSWGSVGAAPSNCRWRRVGDSIECVIFIDFQKALPPGSQELVVSLPQLPDGWQPSVEDKYSVRREFVGTGIFQPMGRTPQPLYLLLSNDVKNGPEPFASAGWAFYGLRPVGQQEVAGTPLAGHYDLLGGISINDFGNGRPLQEVAKPGGGYLELHAAFRIERKPSP
jgi:hypothetical protein